MVTASSIASAFIIYFFFGQNLVYTIVVCVIFSSLVANIFKIDFGGEPVEVIISATATAPNPLNSCVLTISSKKSPTSISRGWIAFFIFLKLFQKYDIIKSNKNNKKGVFLE